MSNPRKAAAKNSWSKRKTTKTGQLSGKPEGNGSTASQRTGIRPRIVRLRSKEPVAEKPASVKPLSPDGLAKTLAKLHGKGAVKFAKVSLRVQLHRHFAKANDAVYEALALVYAVVIALEDRSKADQMTIFKALGCSIPTKKPVLAMLNQFNRLPKDPKARKLEQNRHSRMNGALQEAKAQKVKPNGLVQWLGDIGGIEAAAAAHAKRKPPRLAVAKMPTVNCPAPKPEFKEIIVSVPPEAQDAYRKKHGKILAIINVDRMKGKSEIIAFDSIPKSLDIPASTLLSDVIRAMS